MMKLAELLLAGFILHMWVCLKPESATTGASTTSVITSTTLTTTTATPSTTTETRAIFPDPVFLSEGGYQIYPVYGANMLPLVTKGTRVIRGRDWNRGYEDQGGPGTIIDILSLVEVTVRWDAGLTSSYSMGSVGIYDLYLLAGEEDCRYLVPPEYGTVVYSNGTQIGSVANVSCFDGFHQASSSYALCQTNGSWTRNLTACNSTASQKCGGIINGSEGGILTSPGYPYYFPKKLNCTWTIEVSEQYGISFDFNTAMLPCGDFIKVSFWPYTYDMNCNWIDNVSSEYTQTSNISVTLYTESARQYRGFMLAYKPACKWLTLPEGYAGRSGNFTHFGCSTGHELVGPSLLQCTNNATWNDSMPTCQPVGCSNETILIQDTSYSKRYAFSFKLFLAEVYEECYWIVRGPVNTRVGLVLSDYTQCRFILSVRDGPDSTSTLLARMCYYYFYFFNYNNYNRLSVNGPVARLSVSWIGNNSDIWSPEIIYSAGCAYFKLPSRRVTYSKFTLPGSEATCTFPDMTGNRLSTVCQDDYTWSVSNFTCAGCGGFFNATEYGTSIRQYIYNDDYLNECIWIVQALPNEKITLSCQLEVNGLLQIRDGADATDALLLQENLDPSYYFRSVTSSQHAVRIQLLLADKRRMVFEVSINTGCAPMTLTNGYISYESFYRGTARFICYQGYTMTGRQNVTCMSNFEWSGPVPVCRKTECLPITLYIGGHMSFDSSNLTYIGSVITFQCETSWILVGPKNVTCVNSGDWSDTIPTCERTVCGTLAVVNGSVSYYTESTHGVYASITCNEGYFLFGHNSIQCHANGTWDSTPPECLPDCGNVIANSTKGEIVRGYPVATDTMEKCTWIIQVDSAYVISLYLRHASFVCCQSYIELYDGQNRVDRIVTRTTSTASYVTTGLAARVVYVNSGTRASFRLEFEAQMGCRYLPSPHNGSVWYSSHGIKVGGEANFYCIWPTVLVGQSSLQCQVDREWNGDPPSCVDTGCYENYQNYFRQDVFLSTVTYERGTYYFTFNCSYSDTTMIGRRTVACRNKSFVEPVPTCEFLGCEVSAPTNGMLDFISTVQDGYVFTYKCDSGFHLLGNNKTRLCTYNNVWVHDAPVCTPNVALGGYCLSNSSCSTNGAVCLNSACACSTGVYDKSSDTCDSMPLYQYGVDVGDQSLRKGDDDCSKPVVVPNEIPFYNKLQTKIFVCNNGLVSFEEPFLTPSPLRNISSYESSFLLAPFYVDIDNRDKGSVLYRTYSGTANANNIDYETVSSIDSFIEKQVELKTPFTSTFILLVTWADVVPFEDTLRKTQTATFQLLLATDGFQSYAMYIYGHNRMTWTLAGDDDPHVWIGFWAGEAFHWSHPYSFLPEVLQIDKQAQHKGIHGLYTHSLTPQPVPNPAATCKQWYDENKHKKEEITKAEKRLPNCPCNIESLRLDPWVTSELPVTTDEGDISCVALLYAQRHGDHGKSCCYNITTGLWIQQQPHAGGFKQYHPVEFPKEHSIYDLHSWAFCCEFSSLCHLYYELHPIGRCYEKTTFKLGASWGDPHLRTLDGREYTFNGLGEYILVQLPIAAGGMFELQARTERAIKPDGNLSQATVFSAFAASYGLSVIQVELNFNKTGVVIQANNKDLTSAFYKKNKTRASDQRKSPDELTEPGLAITNLNGTIQTLFTSIGLSFNISVVVRMLSITVTLPIEFENKTRGLLGNYDGDPGNDFIAPNGTLLPNSANMSERDAFKFSQLWAVTENSTLFNYTDGKGHSDYVNKTYEPKFLEDEPDKAALAKGVCGGEENTQCIFDYVFTEDAQAAESTRLQQERAKNTSEYISQPVPSLTGCNVTAVTRGQRAVCKVHFNDDENIEFMFLETMDGVVFNRSSYTIAMVFTDIITVHIRAVVRNTITNKTSPEIVVPILMCSGCSNHGVCTGMPREGETRVAAFSFQACDCDTGYDGADCEYDYDGCRARPCSHTRQCHDFSPEEELTMDVSYSCGSCPQGYVTEGDKCIDIDECIPNNPCQQICINTEGSFKCSCQEGYRASQDNDSMCKDINECEELSHHCQQICHNTDGGYYCSCFSGNVTSSTNGTCLNVVSDKCSTINCSRADGCRQNENNETKCFCNHGFMLTKDNTCQDIDECKEGVHPCPQECENTNGSFRCLCYKGYGREKDNTCKECKVPNWGKDCKSKCQCTGRGAAKCHPVRGCVCMKGWRGDTCDEDIDECEEQTNICPDVRQTCSNTEGSYICTCVAGYQTNGRGGCKDIDECELYTDDCQDKCVNTEGGYVCQCSEGYKRANKTHCQDIDECVGLSAGCEYKCENYPGHFSCYCPFGYVLREDRKSCLKVQNPCERFSNLTCDHFCVIRNESAVCVCKEGYKLGSDKASCNDIDECSTNNDCSNGSVCENLEGSYSCFCPLGTRLDNDERSCVDCDEHHYGKNCESLCQCVKGKCDRRYGCTCMTGWTGEQCDQDVDECADGKGIRLCSQNHTQCVNIPGSYRCQCENGYIKLNDTCSDVDECISPILNTCEQLCTNKPGDYQCSCNSGFRAHGDMCADINECAGIHGCDHLCDNTLGSYRCSCHDGFRLNLTDRHSCVPTNVCPDEFKNNCINGQCSMLKSNSTCQCSKGFELKGNSCVDINECIQVSSLCEHECHNEPGSFRCSCETGYTLDVDLLSCKECDQWSYGANCTQSCLCVHSNTATCNKTNNGYCHCLAGWTGEMCQYDVNECANGTDVCPENSTCNNTNGSYYCICHSGFQKTDNGTCIECDRLHFGVDCKQKCHCKLENTATCDNQNGSCVCLPGWNGANCSDNVDECTDGVHSCPEHSNCIDTIGLYQCTCNSGFTKINGNCTDINECGDNVCDGHNCNNTVGDYMCLCKPGTFGIWDNCTECTDNTYGGNCSLTCGCIHNHTIEPSQSCDRVTGQCLCNKSWSGKRCEVDVNECLSERVCNQFPFSGCLNLPGTYTCDCIRGYTNGSTGECVKDEVERMPAIRNGEIQIFLEIILAVDLPADTDLSLSTTYKSLETRVLVALYLFFNATVPEIEIFIYDIRLGSLIVNASLIYNDTEEDSQLIAQLLSTMSVKGNLFFDQNYVTATLSGNFNNPCEVRTAIIKQCPEHFSCTVTNDLPICREDTSTDDFALYVGLSVGISVSLLCLFGIGVCIVLLRRWNNNKKLDRSQVHASAAREITNDNVSHHHATRSHRLWNEPRKSKGLEPTTRARQEPNVEHRIGPNKGSRSIGLSQPRPFQFSSGSEQLSGDRMLQKGPVMNPTFVRNKSNEMRESDPEEGSNSLVWRRAIWAQQQEAGAPFRIPRSNIRPDKF